MEKAEIDPSSIAVVPLAIPMLSGPGAITSTMLLVNLYPRHDRRWPCAWPSRRRPRLLARPPRRRPALPPHRRPRPRRLHQSHGPPPRRDRHPVHHQRTETGADRDHQGGAVDVHRTSRRRLRREAPSRRASRSGRSSRRRFCSTCSGRSSCSWASSMCASHPGITAFTPLDFYDYPSRTAWSMSSAGRSWPRHRLLAGAQVRGATPSIVGLAVLSHWVLDFITHRPDLPLWPGGPKSASASGTRPRHDRRRMDTVHSLPRLYLRATPRVTAPAPSPSGRWSSSSASSTSSTSLPAAAERPHDRLCRPGAWLFVPWGAWIDAIADSMREER